MKSLIKHIPYHPAREGTPAEVVYLDLWRDYLAANPEAFETIFHDMLIRPGQRQACVAASFMVFMGCNGGADFTYRAERYVESLNIGREPAYVAAWAVHNQRQTGINCKTRTIEVMLARTHPVVNHPFVGTRLDMALLPEITQEDHDAIECMVRWWSGLEAQKLRNIADPLIEARRRKVLSGLFSKEGASHG